MRHLLLISAVVFSMAISTRSFGQIQGLLTVAKGTVKVTRMDGTSSYVKVGDKVSQNDSVETGVKSAARIVMPDTNVIDISSDTKISLEKYVYDPAIDNKQVTLKVDFGRMKTTVKQKYDTEKNKFTVKTPGVVAGVRGTVFSTSYDKSTHVSEVVTLKGLVAVDQVDANGTILKSVLVRKDQMIKAESTKVLGEPFAIPKEFKENMLREDVRSGLAKRGSSFNDLKDSLDPVMQESQRGLATQESNGYVNKRLQPDQGRALPHSRDSIGSIGDSTESRGTASEGNIFTSGSLVSSPTQSYTSPLTAPGGYTAPAIGGSTPTAPGGYTAPAIGGSTPTAPWSYGF